jgi:hypothetical protein
VVCVLHGISNLLSMVSSRYSGGIKDVMMRWKCNSDVQTKNTYRIFIVIPWRCEDIKLDRKDVDYEDGKRMEMV